VDECKALVPGVFTVDRAAAIHNNTRSPCSLAVDAAGGRGLHPSTFRLNVSAFCGIGGAFRGYLGGV
jgi:hypothetical protein